jgi:hypothetical protein
MLEFNNFTINNFEYFKKNKFNINDNNILIKLLKNERINIQNYINNSEFNYKIYNHKNIKLNKLKQYCNNKFTDFKIIDLLNNLNDDYLFISIKWNDNFIKIIINKKYNNILNNFLSRLNIFIKFIEYFKYKTQKNKIINIYFILSEFEKKLPDNNEILNASHVNSGFSDITYNYILIWRLEEFEKVTLHELIHLFDMDCRDQSITDKFNIIGEHRYYEAITDFWAIFYYIIYISILTKIKIKLLLEIEVAFIKNQAMVLNDFFNFNSWTQNTINKTIIKQNSAGLSYYIIKYLIFMYIINYNININYFLDNYDNFLNIILEIGFNKEKFIFINSNSLRMSLIQLN